MKTTKLVTGILSIVFSIMVLFQSCAAGLYNALGQTGESSGTAGVFVALLMIAGGIVQIATKNSVKNGGSIAGLIVFLLGAIIGYTMAGSFADLTIWATLCLILAVLNLISIFIKKKVD